ncbi:MAG: allantoate amidohydrolase [Acidobacteriota bacterium]|nr:allantoate amidohydrolase [Acidobacteriota bacterium]
MPPLATDRARRVIARCRELAACSETATGTQRTFLCACMHQVHARLRQWMEEAGMTVTVDAAGNLRGLYAGDTPTAPRLLIASHLDTVPNAGAFDGVLGVVLGLSLVEELRGARLPVAIEVIGFSEEEGVRFGKPFLGSLALAGQLTPELLSLQDRSGTTVIEAMRAFGLDPAELPRARMARDAVAYLEMHIEQGPVLESQNLPLGVVRAIVGQTRLQATFTGTANHAGTTPMPLRHDALAAAAAWISAVEAYATERTGLVATVGAVTASPNAGNVIAGEVLASLDVRHAEDAVRLQAVEALQQAAQQLATKRGVSVEFRTLLRQDAVPMDTRLTQALEHAAQQAGIQSCAMVSGAGHDAMVLAPHLPACMLFLRSPGGLSHHPDEAVLESDVEAALAAGAHFLQSLRGPLLEELTRECDDA